MTVKHTLLTKTLYNIRNNGLRYTALKILFYLKYKFSHIQYLKKYKKVIPLIKYVNENNNGKKVIVIGPTNDWYYMIQRPQQLAISFSTHGYFVIYISHWPLANRNSYIPISNTLHVLESVDIDHIFEGLSDAIIIFPQNVYWNDKRDKLIAIAQKNLFIYEYLDHIDKSIYQGNSFCAMNDFIDFIIQKQKLFAFIATSKTLYTELKKRGVKTLLYSPNGADTDHFMRTRPSIDKTGCTQAFKNILFKKKPIIGFFGALADWLDYDLVNQAAAICDEYEFVFIGPNCTRAEPRLNTHLSNITWIEAVPYAELPAYAASFDVGIIPFRRGRLAKSTSPVKLFEYFALGLPVVVTEDMLECRKFKEVFSAYDISSFVHALRNALAMKNSNEYILNITRIAQKNSWNERTESIIDFISSMQGKTLIHTH